MISDPEELRKIVPLMKRETDAERAAGFAAVWSVTRRKSPEKAARLSARLEIGRCAQLFKVLDGRASFIGMVNTPKARAYAAQDGNGLIDVTGEEMGL